MSVEDFFDPTVFYFLYFVEDGVVGFIISCIYKMYVLVMYTSVIFQETNPVDTRLRKLVHEPWVIKHK